MHQGRWRQEGGGRMLSSGGLRGVGGVDCLRHSALRPVDRCYVCALLLFFPTPPLHWLRWCARPLLPWAATVRRTRAYAQRAACAAVPPPTVHDGSRVPAGSCTQQRATYVHIYPPPPVTVSARARRDQSPGTTPDSWFLSTVREGVLTPARERSGVGQRSRWWPCPLGSLRHTHLHECRVQLFSAVGWPTAAGSWTAQPRAGRHP